MIVGPAWDERRVVMPKLKQAGIIMSGGIDSWVMYNLMPPNVKIFNIYRADEFDRAERVARLTGRDDIIEIDEPTTDHSMRIPLAINYILDQYDIDGLLYGINQGPPIDVFPGMNTDDRPVRPWRITTPRLYAPFLPLFKYHIVDIAIKKSIDLSDTLSCIRSTRSHCGVCWQCMEKQWAYDQLSS